MNLKCTENGTGLFKTNHTIKDSQQMDSHKLQKYTRFTNASLEVIFKALNKAQNLF